MTAKRKRIEALEAKRRAFLASHVRRSDLSGLLFAVLDVVEGEAGPEAAARCGRRVVEGQAARVLSALEGKTAAQLEDLARRVGLPVGDFAGLTAPALARLSVQWGQP
ncbi:hypothetical protein [Deinococcus frigens]|uniref:hypothetical protein n=1 Tax=Deinococcus frigens TaxID=249403 RepID=UPI00049667AF|nr:hypothetical protein [Deinococcus frigens]